MKIWSHILVIILLVFCGQARSCAVEIALGQTLTHNSRESTKLTATQLNFTGDSIYVPWDFKVIGDFNGSIVPWNWRITDQSAESVEGIVENYWQSVNDTPVTLGALISYTSETPQVNVSLNGEECDVIVTKLESSVASVETTSTPQPMKTLDGQLLGVDGQPVKLIGVNWFGWTSESEISFFDGLWQGPTSLTLDFATIVYRLRLLGINAVRIVFSFDNIFNGKPTNLARNSCSFAQQSDIQKSVTDPEVSVSGQSIPDPLLVNASQPQPAGTCNFYIPTSSVFDAFVSAIRILTSNGIYIILDNQSQSDATVVDNTPQWITYWTTLMTTLWQQPNTAAYVIVDAFNEPDFFNIKFEPSGGLPGARDLYFRLWDAIYAVAPNTMFGFEGLGQGNYVQNWVSLHNISISYKIKKYPHHPLSRMVSLM